MKKSNLKMVSFKALRYAGKHFSLLLLLLCLSVVGFAQRQVTGRVTDSSGSGIPGATVVVKNTTTGTVTDPEGNFSLARVAPGSTLVFSFVGFKTQEIRLGDQAVINVVLAEETIGLGEVVAVGYGTQKKESVVGAISQVATDALVTSGTQSITNAIAGKLSGVLTIQQTGQPGADEAEIVIRGVSSWSGSAPLVLVDGVERDFTTMDPNEIKTVSVLKDASATAVFGAKGANGVIIITTRRGSLGKPQLSISASSGVEWAANLPEHIDSYTTMSMYNVAQMNQQQFSALRSQAELEEYRNPSSRINTIRYPDIDWFELLTHKYAPTTNANVNIQGGTEKMKYFCTLGYYYQGDFFKNENEGALDSRYMYRRINYRTNFDFNLTKSTLLSFNLGGAIGIRNQPTTSPWRAVYSASTALWPAYFPEWVLEEIPDLAYPDASGVRQSQSYQGSSVNPYNYFASKTFARYLISDMFTDLIFDQKLDFITKGLSAGAKASLSTSYQNTALSATYDEPVYQIFWDRIGTDQNPWVRTNEGSDVYVMPPPTISTGAITAHDLDNYFELKLDYNRDFGDHKVTALALANRQQKRISLEFPRYYQGLVGRATYNYKLKYLTELNVGYTGSEQFAPGNRYGLFPSWAVGWVVSEEPFFKQTLPWMSLLKLRYSDGLVGSDLAINRWLYLSDYYIRSGIINEDAGANISAQWEEAHKRDLGIEFGLFKNLIRANIDLYEEKRDKMLLEPRTVTLMVGNVFKELNLGKVKKHGFDLELEFNKTTAWDFNYYVKGLLGFTENRVLFKDDLPYADEYQKNAGKPLDAQMNGVLLTGSNYFTTVDEIHNNPAPIDITKLVLGDYQFLDYNVDGIISQFDRYPVDGSFYPPIVYSFGGGFKYKGFNFNFNFQGNEGKYVSYDQSFQNEFTKQDMRVTKTQLNYWRPDNQTATHPTLHYVSLTVDNVGWSGGSGDQGYRAAIPGYYWRDASYLRLREVYLSYTFTPEWVKNATGISNLMVYGNGFNLWTWTTLPDGDPERKDFQQGFYPQMARLTLGLNIIF